MKAQKVKKTLHKVGLTFVWNTWPWAVKEATDQKAQDSDEQIYICERIDKPFPLTPFTESAIQKAKGGQA
jgi:hypothetical protein